jgi:hypothetical protein
VDPCPLLEEASIETYRLLTQECGCSVKDFVCPESQGSFLHWLVRRDNFHISRKFFQHVAVKNPDMFISAKDRNGRSVLDALENHSVLKHHTANLKSVMAMLQGNTRK